jgi:hypothetical protein
MIPPMIASDAPPGERRVFERLASDPLADDWTVLHSLALAEHVRQVQGEADFLVLVPGYGVAVIEVKSHSRLARLPDGRWQLGSLPPTGRGPFQQADEQMHSILRYLRSRGADLGTIPFVSGVWFTHVRARAALPASPEWHDWQLLDRDDFRLGVARAVQGLLSHGRARLSGRLPALGLHPGQPDAVAVASLAAMLRPRFEVAVTYADVRQDRESQLLAFLDEQFDALDAMADNRSVLFSGPAGSGKTFLAVEAARREQASGGSGGLLCFNRLLGRHLRAATEPFTSLEAGSLHRLLLRVSGLTPPADPDAEFWEEVLATATDRLLESNFARDFLIVDEMQDLTRPEYLDVLDLLVTGGLAGGRCLLFGDFERQALYGLEDGRDVLRARIPGLASHALVANCRNRPRIGAAVELLAAMSPGYKRYRREDDGVQPRYYWYEGAAEQEAKVIQAIRELESEGYALDEIVMLSPRREAALATHATDPWLKRVLTPADGVTSRRGRLRYATIHAFKGLEAAAAVLTDIDDAAAPQFEALLYVGLTRATDRLSLIATRSALRQKLGI